ALPLAQQKPVEMAVSKRLRYEVLRRDNFACRYCGAKAPEAALTVDHVTPIALGGTNDPTNLVAACIDCNAGKSSSNPDAPTVADVNADALRWATSVRSALADISEREIALSEQASELLVFWHGHTWPISRERMRRGLPGGEDTASLSWAYSEFKMPAGGPLSIERFLRYGMPVESIRLAMERATYMTPGVEPEHAFRYFCGICWNAIREAEDVAANGTD
ncbi:MAG: HNH endonuclease signature motif containing protein, partial [Rhodoglobus sp.]